MARAGLLRAAHEAQASKVYRVAAAARTVATLLQAARGDDPQYRLADLSDGLRELLLVTHTLRTGGSTELGTARRQYTVAGSLRLYGLCTTAVLAETGHAGVVTYAVDRRGTIWMVADVMPGDARRAARGGDATVAMGETALTHRKLTRAGLVVSGATAAGTRQLGAGKGVRAVTASGAGWDAEPLAQLWDEPVGEQVHRAFAALAVPVPARTAGADLLFLRVTIRGTDGDAVFAEHADGTALTLRVAADNAALGYRENLRILGRAEGLAMLMVARPDPGRPGTVLPLSVAPVDTAAWRVDGHVDLAFDRLHSSQFPAGDVAGRGRVAGRPGGRGHRGRGVAAGGTRCGPAVAGGAGRAGGRRWPGDADVPGRAVRLTGLPAAQGPAGGGRGAPGPPDPGRERQAAQRLRPPRRRRRDRVRPGLAGRGDVHRRRRPGPRRGVLAADARGLTPPAQG
ncbi:hypothetical protein GCM10020218_092040 [Dactylosporangium vinaceum]